MTFFSHVRKMEEAQRKQIEMFWWKKTFVLSTHKNIHSIKNRIINEANHN